MIRVEDSRELQAAILAFRLAGRDLRKQINDSTRSTFNEPWKAGISSRARTLQERRVLVPGARIAAGNPPEFRAAGSRRALSGGLVPEVNWPWVEFGSTHAPGLPRRRPRGPVWNTLADMERRVPRLWAQLIVRVYSEAAEGR